MGNKHKFEINKEINEPGKIDEKQIISNFNLSFINYLICPYCWNKIPYIKLYIESDMPKIKINCKCLQEPKTNKILSINDYINIIKKRKIDSFVCIYHENENAKSFCLNCENWFCEKCEYNHYIKNSKECSNKMSEENCLFSFCNKHISEKNKFYCIKCENIFCKYCFLNHKIKKEENHKGKNLMNYLTNEKIQKKYNKFNIFLEKIIPLNLEIKNKIINKIDLEDKDRNDEELWKYKKLIEESFIKNKNINALITAFIEILFQNIKYFQDKPILNKKFIINFINNTKFNINKTQSNNNLIIKEEILNTLLYFNSIYINIKLKANLKRNIIKLIKDKENCIIEQLCLLNDNKIASVDNDYIIRIWDIKTWGNIFTFNQHTNKITSVILINNNYLASASNDNTIIIWDYKLGKSITTIITEANPFLIYSIYCNDNQVASIQNRNSIHIYDYFQNNKLILKKNLENIIPWIEGFYRFPKDNRIILSYTGFFSIFSSKIEEIKRISIDKEIPKLFIQINNGDLIVGLLSNEIFIYDKNLFFKARLNGHLKTISGFIQINEFTLLSYSIDSTIKLWNLKHKDIIETFINIDNKINSVISIENQYIIASINNKGYNLELLDIDIFSK